MKSFIVTILLFTNIVFANTNLVEAYEISQLESIKLDSQLELKNIRGGHVSVHANDEQPSIRLTLYRHYRCPRGRYCLAVMPTPYMVELPLTSQITDSCGNTTYVGSLELRPVDGDFKVIVVTDHTNNRCMHLLALPAVSVTYETISSGFNRDNKTVETFSTMTGLPFQTVDPNQK